MCIPQGNSFEIVHCLNGNISNYTLALERQLLVTQWTVTTGRQGLTYLWGSGWRGGGCLGGGGGCGGGGARWEGRGGVQGSNPGLNRAATMATQTTNKTDHSHSAPLINSPDDAPNTTVIAMSVHFKIIYMYELGKAHTRSTPSLRSFPITAFETVPAMFCDWRWSSLGLSRKIVERFLFPRLSPPGDRWCDVLDFVAAGSVSSSSKLRIFLGASHMWWLIFPPVTILSAISHHSGMSRARSALCP